MQPHDLLYPFANLASYGGHLSHWLMGETKVECGVSEWDNEYVPSVCNDNHLKSATKPLDLVKKDQGKLTSNSEALQKLKLLVSPTLPQYSKAHCEKEILREFEQFQSLEKS